MTEVTHASFSGLSASRRRLPVASATVWSTFALAATLGLGSALSQSTAGTTLSGVLAITAAIIVWSMAMSIRHPSLLGVFNPSVLLFGYLLLVYVGRPLYILGAAEYGTQQLGRHTPSGGYAELISTSLVVLVAITLFTVGYWLIPGVRLGNYYNRLLSRRRRYGFRLFFLFAVSGVAALYVLEQALASFGDIRVALSQRATLFAGEQYLIFALQAYKFGYLFWLADLLSSGRRVKGSTFLWAIVLWLPTFGFDFLTGSRADLIYRNLLPVAAVLCVAIAIKPPRLRYALVPMLIAVVAFVGIRVNVRDAAAIESGAEISQSSVIDTLTELPNFVLSGDEAAVYDAFVIIRQQSQQVLPPRGVEGALAILLAPVPSGILSEKPIRSTTYFTELVRPDLAAKGGNVAISSLGDLYIIGGLEFSVLGYLAIGFLAGGVVRASAYAALRPVARKQVVVLGFAAVAGMMSVIRADLTELSLLVLRIGLPIAVAWYLSFDSGRRSGGGT